MPKIYKLSATELVEKIQNKSLTCTEVASAFISRIQSVNQHINALQQFDPERIHKEAIAADNAIASGQNVGKLHGLPITIKDACHVKGFQCSKGFSGFLGAPSTFDSTVVARLKAAGAIILGITNTPELLLSYETDNLIYGRTNNPYDLSRTPGGSSGGEAAIISAGGSPAGIGSDAGGSIRQPAHYSGICGHKPTQGLVPLTGNIPKDGAGIVTQILSMGPMSRFAVDLPLILSVISGFDKKDPHSVPISFNKPKPIELGNLRIAYFYHSGDTIACGETIKAIDAVVEKLKPKVNVIKEAFPRPLEDTYRLHWETMMLGGDQGELLKNLYQQFAQKNISLLAQEFISSSESCLFSTKDLRQRFLEIEQFRYNMMLFMHDFDIILSPVSATPARIHGETHKNIKDFTYATAHNLTGWPATAVPCAISKNGLPIAVQIASTPWKDGLCLEFAQIVQQLFGVLDAPDIHPCEGEKEN